MDEDLDRAALLFPQRLKAQRERRGLRAYILSELCGLNRYQVYRYEHSGRLPSISVLFRLCDALDCSADYLIGRTESPQ